MNNATIDDTCSVTSNDDTSSQCSLDVDNLLPSVSTTLIIGGDMNNIGSVNRFDSSNCNVTLAPFSNLLNLSLSASQICVLKRKWNDIDNWCFIKVFFKFVEIQKYCGVSLLSVPPQCVKSVVEVKKRAGVSYDLELIFIYIS